MKNIIFIIAMRSYPVKKNHVNEAVSEIHKGQTENKQTDKEVSCYFIKRICCHFSLPEPLIVPIKKNITSY